MHGIIIKILLIFYWSAQLRLLLTASPANATIFLLPAFAILTKMQQKVFSRMSGLSNFFSAYGFVSAQTPTTIACST